MKKKILLVSDFHANVYAWRKEIIEKNIEIGNDVALAVPYGEKLEYFKEIGCELFDVKLNRSTLSIFDNLKLFRQYKTILKKYKPDIVLLYGSKGMLYNGLLCKKMKINYIVNINGLGTFLDFHFPIKNIIFKLYKMVVPFSNCVFYQNESNFTILKEMNIFNSNSVILPGSGINLEVFPYCSYPSNKEVTFLFSARLIKEKGIYEYIEAAKLLIKNGKKCRFIVIGMCDDDKILKYLDENKNFIEFLGFQNDVHSYIEMSDCVVLPSYYGEGISNSLLESAATGRPIITTTLPGCKETVDDLKTGFLVEPKNAQSLYEAMNKIVCMSIEDRSIMGKKGRVLMEEKFDRNIVVNAYMNEINKIKVKDEIC